jgi:hypothetical protein
MVQVMSPPGLLSQSLKTVFKIQKGFRPNFVGASDPSLAGLLIIWINTQENMRTLIFRIKDWKAL